MSFFFFFFERRKVLKVASDLNDSPLHRLATQNWLRPLQHRGYCSSYTAWLSSQKEWGGGVQTCPGRSLPHVSVARYFPRRTVKARRIENNIFEPEQRQWQQGRAGLGGWGGSGVVDRRAVWWRKRFQGGMAAGQSLFVHLRGLRRCKPGRQENQFLWITHDLQQQPYRQSYKRSPVKCPAFYALAAEIIGSCRLTAFMSMWVPCNDNENNSSM